MADAALQSWVPSSARRLAAASWFAVGCPPTSRARTILGVLSFLIPIVLWSLVSYVPFIWHPLIEISNPGSVSYFEVGMRSPKDAFADEVAAGGEGRPGPSRGPSSQPGLPARAGQGRQGALECHLSGQRRKPVVAGCLLAFGTDYILGLSYFIVGWCSARNPMRLLYATIGRLTEPFVEFFRYLPAPAFGALAVAILGIYDGPKIAIVVIGTFFQQVLIIAGTTRRVDYALLEAAQTLGAGGCVFFAPSSFQP